MFLFKPSCLWLWYRGYLFDNLRSL